MVLLTSELPNRFHQGKVRDTYDLGEHLLMVATDRISAFDVVLPTGTRRALDQALVQFAPGRRPMAAAPSAATTNAMAMG